MVTPASFRINFPEFSSQSDYPDVFVQINLDVAYSLLNKDAWGDTLDYGIQLFIAHQLAVSARDEKTAAAGGIPGSTAGMVSAKSVDKVSVSYDTSSIAIDGAGYYNSTIYGIRFYTLARMVGAGGVQL